MIDRTMRLLLPFCAAALFASAADTIPAQQGIALALDPAQSKVEFTLGDVLHTVHGTFQLTAGTVHFDPASGKASGELVVDARSGDSGSKARDKRMHANILESEKYPQVTFKPDHFEGHVAPEGKSEVKVHGMFSIHGTEHEVTAPAEVDVNGGVYRFSAAFDVPYVKWGMKNPSTLFLRVSDTVQIKISSVAKTQ